MKINRRNGLEFDAILNSDVLGVYKPEGRAYKTALRALQADNSPAEVAMIAAHAYDLKAAKK